MTREQTIEYYRTEIKRLYAKNTMSNESDFIALYEDILQQLEEKDNEIAKYDNIAAELLKSRSKCLEHIEQLEAVIEKQAERIRYLEQQFRDLNPKEINQ